MNVSGTPGALRTLTSLIDDEALSGYQLMIILLCALIAMIDGFDTQAIAFVAPSIAAALQLPIAEFGPVFAAGLLGGLIGALVLGRLADRVGRKPTLGLALMGFAAGSVATIWSESVPGLIACRLVTGLGLGGAIPCVISMTAEYTPRRLRATFVTAMFCGFPLGAVIGAALAARLLPAHGWKIIFISGGCLPLLLFPVVILAMPESLRWLAAHQQIDKIEKILARMARNGLWDRQLSTDRSQEEAARLGINGLFAAGRGHGTLLLWLISFLSLLLAYQLVSWVPTIAQQVGNTAQAAALAAATMNLSGIVGGVCFARLMDRFDAFNVVSLAYLGGAVGGLGIALATDLATSIYWLAALTGFFCIGAQLCVVAITSSYYPLELRATGVGWVMGMGRVGAIAGPLIGGLLIGRHELLFVVAACTSFAAALAVLVMGGVSRRRAAAT